MEEQDREKTRRKRERNRIAAAKCREKKVKKIDYLETQVKDLKENLVNTQLERDYYKVKCNNIVDAVNSYIRNNKVDIPIVEISKIIEQQSTDDAENKQNQANQAFPTFEQSQMVNQRVPGGGPPQGVIGGLPPG